MRFETYRKRGNGWEYLGIVDRKDSLHAAYAVSYVQNIKVVGVRPEDSRDKIYTHRLKNVASITYA